MPKTNSPSYKPIIDYIDQHCATKDDIARLVKRIDHLPTKSEFYEVMDQVMGELKTIREEQKRQITVN